MTIGCVECEGPVIIMVIDTPWARHEVPWCETCKAEAC